MIPRRRKGGMRSDGKDERRSGQFNSLFGEILDWMLAPLLFLWPISISVTHNVANNIANDPYDRAMAESVRALARLVTIDTASVRVDFPAPPRTLFRADPDDTVYYQVAGYRGEIIAGDAEIPRTMPPVRLFADEVLYRDAMIHGEEVRVAYQFLRTVPEPGSPLVLVQVAETRNKRSALASEVVTGVLLPQFAIIPIAVVLVWVGLSRGIAPLNRLQAVIRQRRPTDLAPISTSGVPEEARPLIVAFNEMMVRLEENLQAQQRFIADAAHQMRTPLTGLRMQTELALEETDPVQQREALLRIASSAERASHLINQLLTLARAESSSETIYTVEQVNLDLLVREAARDLFPRAQSRSIDLGVEESGWPLLVDGNPVMLREMIANLIDNAIKYTPEGGSVTARTLAGRVAILEVEDTGIGIAEEDRERVFERFFRVLGSGEDGSGLGLAIVREIAELHRATVSLESPASGQGTLIRVVFPPSKLPRRPVSANREAPH